MKSLLFVVLMFPPLLHAEGGGDGVGNGGDSVYCNRSTSNNFVGYYNVDYIANKVNGMEFADQFERVVRPSDPATANFTRIINAVREYPYLAHELTAFRDLIGSNRYGLRYVWKRAPFGVTEINDEQLRLQVPPNCVTANQKLIQTVFRTGRDWQSSGFPKHSLYKDKGADFTIATEVVNQMSSLQLSFLYFHEWLWNLTRDPEVIRDANAIFHSAEWSLPGGADRMVALLKSLNWKSPHPAMKPHAHYVFAKANQ
jgi:hypothetical protein